MENSFQVSELRNGWLSFYQEVLCFWGANGPSGPILAGLLRPAGGTRADGRTVGSSPYRCPALGIVMDVTA